MLADYCLCAFGALIYDLLDLDIDEGLNLLSVRLRVLRIWEGNVTQGCVHTEFGNDVVSDVVGLFQVIVCSSCNLVKEKELGTSTAQNKADPIHEFFPSLKLVLIQKVLGES